MLGKLAGTRAGTVLARSDFKVRRALPFAMCAQAGLAVGLTLAIQRRAPEPNEAEALRALDAYLGSVPSITSAEDLQTEIYEIGKRGEFAFESLRDWFRALYETLLGSSQGPRMGSFIALYGIDNTRRLIAEALAR